MKNRRHIFRRPGCVLGILLLLISCSKEQNQTVEVSDSVIQKAIPDYVDFNFHVKPILSDRCFKCHGPDVNAREAGLTFHTKEGAFAALGENLDRHAIVAGDAANSTLIARIFTDLEEDIMPPPESNLKLENHEKEILKKWIEQGAEWKQHWSFSKPEKADVPVVQNSDWIQNEIDNFVLYKIESNGLRPTEKTSREKLIRRATFDLTGLPPSLEEITQFVNDENGSAYEQLIDRLLLTDSYAERMSTLWLDISRYADTNGYQDDFERFNWPWRDWVIHAYKQNMPFDQFVTWQLAGDLLPSPNLEQVMATGFNRNHKITNEGGVIPEEYRVEYVSDRTNTFATAFLGLTFECAKCHDHKYDPISQKNYYELFSFFNNVPEEGFVANGQKPEPTITLTDKEIKEKLTFINSLGSMKELNYMVMKEMSPPRQAHVLSRGAYDQPTESVYPNTPTDILPFDDQYDKNRLGLSNWLFSPDNPLTARVTINRLWQQLFGSGIVSTAEDFGNQGALPTHPQLLDYLAIQFQEEDWNIQAMLKKMMMSATYQQSSKVSKELLDMDPENRLLARAPRLRLPAEMIRDHALEISDLLVHQVGGPSVKPYQPEGLWQETTGGGGGSTAKYEEDDGNGLYRRSLYTFWKRTVPPPSMMTFDAASRDFCTVKRQNTSTPLQALVMLNDPQIVEAARMLAYRSIDKIEEEMSKRISYMFHLATSRQPDELELTNLEEYFQEELNRFTASPSAATEYLEVGNFQMEKNAEPAKLAAYSSVASVILNLDESIIRG